jgi:D-alanyl-D-alanine carboxypeptidase
MMPGARRVLLPVLLGCIFGCSVPPVPEAHRGDAVRDGSGGPRTSTPRVPGSAAATSAPPGASSVASPRGALSESIADALQRTLDAGSASQKILGAVAMVSTPEGIWSGATGFADAAATVAMTPRHHFRIGSITKTFTAALVLQLVDEGRIALGDTIDRWLPSLPSASTITVAELLNHTSGFFDYAAGTEADGLPDRPPPDTFLAIVAKHPLDFSPGSRWEYSNSNYVALGAIIERAAGRSLASQIEERLAQPLGLSDTYLPEGAERSGLAQGTRLEDGRYVDITDTTYSRFYFADGGITSSVADVHAWNRLLLGGRVVSAKALSLMKATAPQSIDGAGPGTGYGFGLQSVATALGTEYGHSGGMYGFMCGTYYYPELDVGVTVLTNSDEADSFALGESLAAVVRPPGGS